MAGVTELDKALYNADGTGTLADNRTHVADVTPDEATCMLAGGTDGTNVFPLKTNADGELLINLEAADIEIGAVELKNATTDDRALIGDANTARAATDHVLLVQAIDAAGGVLGGTAAEFDTIVSTLQTIDNIVGTTDSEAPTQVAMVGGLYEDTLTEVEDGDIAAISVNAFRQVEVAGYDRATNTVLITDPDPLAAKSASVKLIDVTLDADPTSDTSASTFIGDCNKVAFIIKTDVDWTDSDPDILVTYTFEVSPDESEWVECDVVMTDDGEDAPVASVIHTTDGDADLVTEEVCYFPIGFTAQYVRVVATATGSDADDTAACSVWLQTKKG